MAQKVEQIGNKNFDPALREEERGWTQYYNAGLYADPEQSLANHATTFAEQRMRQEEYMRQLSEEHNRLIGEAVQRNRQAELARDMQAARSNPWYAYGGMTDPRVTVTYTSRTYGPGAWIQIDPAVTENDVQSKKKSYMKGLREAFGRKFKKWQR